MKNKRNRIKLKKLYKDIMIAVTIFFMLIECIYIFCRYVTVVNRNTEEAETYGESIATNIRLSMEHSISISSVMKSLYLEYEDNFLRDFDKICDRLSGDDNSISGMYFAPGGVIEYAYPEVNKESSIGFDILSDPLQSGQGQLAINTGNVTIAGPLNLVEGGVGIVIRNPVFIENEFIGFAIVVLNYDRFFYNILNDVSSGTYHYKFAVWDESDSNVVTDRYGFFLNSGNTDVDRDVDIRINLPNAVWHLAVEPVKGWNIWGRLIPEFCISIIFIGVLLYVIYLKLRKNTEVLNLFQCDELTGIYTKQVFYHNAKQIIDKNPNSKYTIVVTDIENFKMVNNIYGENKGDSVLKYLAGVFRNSIGDGELCGRLGGDQFVFLLQAKYENGPIWMKSIIDEIQNTSPIPGIMVKFGIYQLIDRTLSIAAMTDRALLAVKSIKRNYDKIYEHYDGPVSKKHYRIQMFESNFERAIQNEEFVVWFQPKYDATSERIVGAEALVRWITKDGEFISPGEFIPTFEEDGLIVRLDEYVFRKVCETVRTRMDENKCIYPVSINLSRASLFHEGTVEKYKKIAEETGVPPEYIPIELTESAALHSVEIKELTQKLKEAGFQLHMDDFGSGLSSLASFNILPFDVVKLDKTLIDFIGDASGDELLKHTISLAHFKEMKVVAEGVETREQLDFLKKLACDVIQGYYFSKPRPYKEFIEFLDEFGEGE